MMISKVKLCNKAHRFRIDTQQHTVFYLIMHMESLILKSDRKANLFLIPDEGRSANEFDRSEK